MMPPPGPQIYPRARMTLTFDVMTLKVDRFIRLPRGPFVLIFMKTLFIPFRNIMSTNMVTDERTHGRTDGQTDRLTTLCLRLPI